MWCMSMSVVYECEHVHVCKGALICGGQGLILSVICHYSSLYVWRQGFPWNLELAFLTRLAG